MGGWAQPDEDRFMIDALRTPEALTRWMAFNWIDNNLLGLQGMVEREARDA